MPFPQVEITDRPFPFDAGAAGPGYILRLGIDDVQDPPGSSQSQK